MSLEKIVRPFQTPEVFDARTLTPQQLQDENPDDAVATWGAPSSGDYTQFQISGLVGGTTTYTEKSRVTENVRVENPDDPSQFVEVERIKELRMANEQGNELLFKLNS